MKDISNILSIESLHDKIIKGLFVSPSSSLHVVIYDESDKNYEGDIVFEEVVACRFEDFRIGNIISDIVLLDISDTYLIKTRLTYLFDLTEKNSDKNWVQDIYNNINTETYLLIDFSTSYGLHGSLICQKIVYLKPKLDNTNTNKII